VEREGGVTYVPSGTVEIIFSYSLGHASNNQVEAYAFLQGIYVSKKQQVHQLNILIDSKNTIKYFIQGSSMKDAHIGSIARRIWLFLNSIPYVSIFQIL
jgi:ribonuclease HI